MSSWRGKGQMYIHHVIFTSSVSTDRPAEAEMFLYLNFTVFLANLAHSFFQV
jgi:hypothetical protein